MEMCVMWLHYPTKHPFAQLPTTKTLITEPPVGLVWFGYGSRDIKNPFNLEKMSCVSGFRVGDIVRCRAFFNFHNITDTDLCFYDLGNTESAYYDHGAPLFSRRDKQITVLGVGTIRFPAMDHYLYKYTDHQLFMNVYDSVNEIRAAMTELDRFRP